MFSNVTREDLSRHEESVAAMARAMAMEPENRTFRTALALARFEAHDINTTDPALLAEDLRLAARALGRVTGRVGVEDILDKIFSQFCISK